MCATIRAPMGTPASIRVVIAAIFVSALSLIVLWRPTARVFRKLRTSPSDESRIAGCWIASLAALAIFANPPTRNESKLVFPLFLLISPFIGVQLVEMMGAAGGAGRKAILFWIAVLFLVPPVLTVRGFLLDRPSNPAEAKRANISSADREVLDLDHAKHIDKHGGNGKRR